MKRYALLAAVFASLGYGGRAYQVPRKADPAPAPAPADPPLPDPGLTARLDGIDQRFDALVPELAGVIRAVKVIEGKLAALPADRSGEALERADALSRLVGSQAAEVQSLAAELKTVKGRIPVLRPGESFLIRSPYAER